MPEAKANPPQPKSARESIKRAAMGALFFLILFIPRIRRLRRRVWAWTLVRIALAVAGGALLWRAWSAHAAAGLVFGGLILAAFALFVRAKPQVKTLEEKARELGALVVLNGGTFLPADGAAHPGSEIFVLAERLVVFDGRDVALGEIPLAGVQRFAARPAAPGAVEEGKAWELEIVAEPASARFRYEGFFAEHLARVAETTLRNLRAQELAVLR